MQTFKFTPYTGTDGIVTAYLHDLIDEMPNYRTQYPVVVVCPGGGYNFCSQREADPVAFEYFAKGFNVFILNYSVKEKAKNFTPLKELSSAIMQIRKNANEWHCKPDQIAVCGFSAGGHLTASLATLWNNEKFLEHFDNENGLNKPNLAILGYTVVTSEEPFAHIGSIKRASGDDEFMWEFFSLEKHVSKDTPPCFIWHTVQDTIVPVENAILMMSALQKNAVPFEAHIFPTGEHGASVYTKEVERIDYHNKNWLNLSIEFLNKMFDYEQ